MAYTFETEHTGNISFSDRSDTVGFITTDTPDYVLVGSAEDEYLVWRDVSLLWTFQTKN